LVIIMRLWTCAVIRLAVKLDLNKIDFLEKTIVCVDIWN
jgi:hypothetical protein